MPPRQPINLQELVPPHGNSRCRVCSGVFRGYVEDELRQPKRRSYRAIADRTTVEYKLEPELLHTSVTAHHKHMSREVRPSVPDTGGLLADLVGEVLQEADRSPPTIKALYYSLAEQLRVIHEAKPSYDALARTAKAISEVTGMRQQQAMLLAYADRAFAQLSPPSTEITVGEIEPSDSSTHPLQAV